MEIIEFEEQNIVYAEDQPEYLPMPAYRDPHDVKGTVICCWKLTEEEKKKVMETGVIWQSMLTFHDTLQPQLLSVDTPFIAGFEKDAKDS